MKQPNFDIIARPYRWLEYLSLGRTLERCRFHFLPQLRNCRHALVLGDGDGRFTAQLFTANPQIEVNAIDISQTMLTLLRRRSQAASSRLRTQHAEACTLFYEHEGYSYDLVVTNFFFDCLSQTQLDQLIGRITPAVAPGALWLVSDFRVPDGPMRLPARVYIRCLYFAFRVITGLRTTQLPDYSTPMTQQGFLCIARHNSLCGLLTTEVWRKCDDKPLFDEAASDKLNVTSERESNHDSA